MESFKRKLRFKYFSSSCSELVSGLQLILLLSFILCTQALPKGNLLNKNVKVEMVPKANTSVLPAKDVVTSCRAFIEEFSQMASNFTKCSIRNARPVRFCEFCVKDYVTAKSMYQSIMEGMTKDGKDEPCGKMILNNDRVQIIVQTAQFIDKIWTDGNCRSCFNFYEHINGTSVTYEIANDTKRFQHLYEQTWNCFQNNSIFTSMAPFPPSNVTSNTTVCKNCRPYYESTNTFYVSLEAKYKHLVCMDVVDSMNRTRILWSQSFKCSRSKEDVVGVLILSALFALMPLIFYVSAKIYGSRMEHKILEQKRLQNYQKASTSREGEQETSTQ